ncbi:MAG: hypothetical protein ACW99U_11555 [Candidatus Thorarchaeota archaeon]
MIRTEAITRESFMSPEEGREVDLLNDPELVRLVALNLELAVRNLITSQVSPDCCILTADICTHRLVAMPEKNGEIKVLVYDA